jgi:hypothetical protein
MRQDFLKTISFAVPRCIGFGKNCRTGMQSGEAMNTSAQKIFPPMIAGQNRQCRTNVRDVINGAP